jgi:hypothetical protein
MSGLRQANQRFPSRSASRRAPAENTGYVRPLALEAAHAGVPPPPARSSGCTTQLRPGEDKRTHLTLRLVSGLRRITAKARSENASGLGFKTGPLSRLWQCWE